jgi:hypothetical protein
MRLCGGHARLAIGLNTAGFGLSFLHVKHIPAKRDTLPGAPGPGERLVMIAGISFALFGKRARFFRRFVVDVDDNNDVRALACEIKVRLLTSFDLDLL